LERVVTRSRAIGDQISLRLPIFPRWTTGNVRDFHAAIVAHVHGTDTIVLQSVGATAVRPKAPKEYEPWKES